MSYLKYPYVAALDIERTIIRGRVPGYQQSLRIRRGLNLSLLLRKQALQNDQRKHNGGQTQNGWQK